MRSTLKDKQARGVVGSVKSARDSHLRQSMTQLKSTTALKQRLPRVRRDTKIILDLNTKQQTIVLKRQNQKHIPQQGEYQARR